MFTGLIQQLGRVVYLAPTSGGARLVVDGRFEPPLEAGESVAVNGACLTALHPSANQLQADVSQETLDKTNVGEANPGWVVNLERALTLAQPLGGHFVTGHVDGVGVITRWETRGDYRYLEIEAPSDIAELSVAKGSIAVDGISLTLNTVVGTRISMMVIPHTLGLTNLEHRRVGGRVNLESDILGKYVLKIMSPYRSSESGLTLEKLARAGFLAGGDGHGVGG